MRKHIFFFLCGICLCFTNLYSQCFMEENYTSTGTYTYIIPGPTDSAFVIEIECVGGDGDFFYLNGNEFPGGSGATMIAQFSVFGGDELTVFVGESGVWNGGNPSGGGGGGGSRLL